MVGGVGIRHAHARPLAPLAVRASMRSLRSRIGAPEAPALKLEDGAYFPWRPGGERDRVRAPVGVA